MPHSAARPIPPELLDASIEGLHLDGSTLREELGADRCLLVFLRHFG